MCESNGTSCKFMSKGKGLQSLIVVFGPFEIWIPEVVGDAFSHLAGSFLVLLALSSIVAQSGRRKALPMLYLWLGCQNSRMFCSGIGCRQVGSVAA